jgi:hypothetical protein
MNIVHVVNMKYSEILSLQHVFYSPAVWEITITRLAVVNSQEIL